ncbi:Cna B-type domain-containing protein [Lacticaseibacillus sharpeae]|nr:Cna B-type domain-containing protein [Lacticaseibacillus sharpeae]
MRAKTNKRLLKGLTLLMMVLGFFAVSQRSADAAVTPAQIQPFDSAKDMQNAGDEADLFLYNVFLTGNHSANKADTEGAIAVQGSSYIPTDGQGFNYGAYFQKSKNGVGQDIISRNKIVLLIGGKIFNHETNSVKVGGGQGYLVTTNEDNWVASANMQAAGGIRQMTNTQMSNTFQALTAKENQLNGRLASYTRATTDEKAVDGGYPVGSYTAKPSVQDPHVYVVNVEPTSGDTIYMPQVAGLDKLVDDPELKEIIFTTSAKKVVMVDTALYQNNVVNINAEHSSDAYKIATKISNKTLFYLPNATQVTNYSCSDGKSAPDIHDGDSGMNSSTPVDDDGNDLYNDDYFANYVTHQSTAIAGTVFAPNATIVFHSGNINGYVMAKNFHQRNGAEAHNFYNPWLESTDVQFTKIWDDDSNRDGIRPEKLTFTVYDDQNNKVTTITIDADKLNNQQTFSLDNLPKYDTNGKLIQYHVVEEPLDSDKYESKTSDDGKSITNQHTPETTTFQVTKQWLDHNNYLKQRPAGVQMQLYQQDTVEKDAPEVKVGPPVTLNDANKWTYKWEDLKKNIAGGHLLLYSVKEVTTVKGYEATSTTAADKLSTTVTNTYHPTTFRVRLTKHDENSHATLKGATYRLGTVTKDGKVVKDATAQDNATDEHGQLSFTNIPWVADKVYYLQEITAPNGYLLDEKIYPVHVKADAQTAAKYVIEFDGKEYPLELDNGNAQAEPLIDISRTDAPAPVLPHTGGEGRHPWLIVGLTSVFLGGIALYLRKAWGVM